MMATLLLQLIISVIATVAKIKQDIVIYTLRVIASLLDIYNSGIDLGEL